MLEAKSYLNKKIFVDKNKKKDIEKIINSKEFEKKNLPLSS